MWFVVLGNLHQAFVTAMHGAQSMGTNFHCTSFGKAETTEWEKKPWIVRKQAYEVNGFNTFVNILNLLILEKHAIIHKINCFYLIIVFANYLFSKLKGERPECLRLWFSVVHACIVPLFTLICIPSAKMLNFHFALVPGAEPDCNQCCLGIKMLHNWWDPQDCSLLQYFFQMGKNVPNKNCLQLKLYRTITMV